MEEFGEIMMRERQKKSQSEVKPSWVKSWKMDGGMERIEE
jgi:hypothetical protein